LSSPSSGLWKICSSDRSRVSAFSINVATGGRGESGSPSALTRCITYLAGTVILSANADLIGQQLGGLQEPTFARSASPVGFHHCSAGSCGNWDASLHPHRHVRSAHFRWTQVFPSSPD